MIPATRKTWLAERRAGVPEISLKFLWSASYDQVLPRRVLAWPQAVCIFEDLGIYEIDRELCRSRVRGHQCDATLARGCREYRSLPANPCQLASCVVPKKEKLLKYSNCFFETGRSLSRSMSAESRQALDKQAMCPWDRAPLMAAFLHDQRGEGDYGQHRLS